MISRNEIRPETIDACHALDANHAAELEGIIDRAIDKHKMGNVVGRTVVIVVNRFTLRAIEDVRQKYALDGWGTLVTSSTHTMGTNTELHIQW